MVTINLSSFNTITSFCLKSEGQESTTKFSQLTLFRFRQASPGKFEVKAMHPCSLSLRILFEARLML
jgi:hypothetical protein